MTEQLEKVCKGLECCVLRDPDDHRRCGECPYNPHAISNEPCANGLKFNALALIRQQQERIRELEAARQWISVKDKLPEEHESIFHKLLGTPKWSNSMWQQESEKVLVYVYFPDGTGIVTTGCLHNSDWITTVSKALPQTVTHWMPLPEPPKEMERE